MNREALKSRSCRVAFGEDTTTVAAIRARKLLHTFHAPMLYTYVVHGNNSCDRQHFDELIRYAGTHPPRHWLQLLEQDDYKRLEQQLRPSAGGCLRNWSCAETDAFINRQL